MLNVRLNREPITRRASIAAAALLVAVTVLVAGFGVSAQSFSTVSGSIVDQFTRALAGRHPGALEPAEPVEVPRSRAIARGTTSSSACRRATTCSPRSYRGLPPSNAKVSCSPGRRSSRTSPCRSERSRKRSRWLTTGSSGRKSTALVSGRGYHLADSVPAATRRSAATFVRPRRHGTSGRFTHGHASGLDRARGSHRGRRARAPAFSLWATPDPGLANAAINADQRVGIHADVPGLPADRGPHEGARELRGEVDNERQPRGTQKKVQSSKF